MIFKRYANPFQLINSLESNKLVDFFVYIAKEEREEVEEEFLFNTWLHKVWDKDYASYKNDLKKKTVLKSNPQQTRKMNEEEEKENIEKANRILGVKIDGTI